MILPRRASEKEFFSSGERVSIVFNHIFKVVCDPKTVNNGTRPLYFNI